jgi:hypothetical protein
LLSEIAAAGMTDKPAAANIDENVARYFLATNHSLFSSFLEILDAPDEVWA